MAEPRECDPPQGCGPSAPYLVPLGCYSGVPLWVTLSPVDSEYPIEIVAGDVSMSVTRETYRRPPPPRLWPACRLAVRSLAWLGPQFFRVWFSSWPSRFCLMC